MSKKIELGNNEEIKIELANLSKYKTSGVILIEQLSNGIIDAQISEKNIKIKEARDSLENLIESFDIAFNEVLNQLDETDKNISENITNGVQHV